MADARMYPLNPRSTGMDPASRRMLWAAIQRAKQGRAVSGIGSRRLEMGPPRPAGLAISAPSRHVPERWSRARSNRINDPGFLFPYFY